MFAACLRDDSPGGGLEFAANRPAMRPPQKAPSLPLPSPPAVCSSFTPALHPARADPSRERRTPSFELQGRTASSPSLRGGGADAPRRCSTSLCPSRPNAVHRRASGSRRKVQGHTARSAMNSGREPSAAGEALPVHPQISLPVSSTQRTLSRGPRQRAKRPISHPPKEGALRGEGACCA